MAYETIFLPFLNDRDGRPTFETAVTVGRTFGSHIAGRYLRAPVPPSVVYGVAPTSPLFINTYIESYKELQETLSGEQKASFESLCEAAGVPLVSEGDTRSGEVAASWALTESDPLAGLPAEARVADLTVMPCLAQGAPMQNFDQFGRLLTRARTPVLVSGPDPMTEMPKTAVVAWNGGSEAAAAASASVPLLKHASDVVILTVGEIDYDLPSADRLRIRLARCGIEARVEEAEDKGADGAVFLDQGITRAADIIVMGAYSRPRIAEAVFGGFTKHLLANAPCPLFVSQ